ncbi:DUF1295 domain-containing protein [Candidatus Saccharibacteria bacterium]|nr:DUF1295 domain-containing protein [Candidatus Saccharibacteria bacterium]
MVIQIVFFVFASKYKTDKFTDLSYGLSFTALAIYSLINSDQISNYQIILLSMIAIWSIRISGYLLIRIIKTGKDARFDGIRENFWKFARFWLLQGFSIWVISLPAIYLLSLNQPTEINIWAIIGLIIWLSGLFIETLADLQLYKFRFGSHPKTNPWIDSGLWYYSRHPNYFGEILLWWGVFIYGASYYTGTYWLTILGPIFITLLITKVSGIPILEKSADQRWSAKSAYLIYKEKTPVLIPNFFKARD